jgi:HSP20 family protein
VFGGMAPATDKGEGTLFIIVYNKKNDMITITNKPSATVRKSRSRKNAPAINMDNTGPEYIVYVMVPGMQRNDFNVHIKKDKLIITAAKKEALHCYTNEELTYAKWIQSFTLPSDADTLMTAALYKNGELEIHIPKGESPVKDNEAEVFVY